MKIMAVVILAAFTIAASSVLSSTSSSGNSNPVTVFPSSSSISYLGISQYYDNRKAVVTSSNDDYNQQNANYTACVTMLDSKGIYNTIGVTTYYYNQSANWAWIQGLVNMGYTEVASHSRSHISTPFRNGTGYESYAYEINGSKQDILGNLALASFQGQYVLTWIEPGGATDSAERQMLGSCHYLVDRADYGGVATLASWDPVNDLFNRIGFTVEMGTPPWTGATSNLTLLESDFSQAYNSGGIFHLLTHAGWVDWSSGSYADQFTTYISHRSDVWYVPFGMLYEYEYVRLMNVTTVSQTSSNTFTVQANDQALAEYGLSYPMTYTFSIPLDWTSGSAYYRYSSGDSWTLLSSPSGLFNGATAARFNFASGMAYVSVPFSGSSQIQIMIHGS